MLQKTARRAATVLALILSLGTLSTLVATTASAETVAAKKAEAARVASQLETLGQRASIMDEAYNEARLKASDADARARSAEAELAATTAKAQTAGDALKKMSVTAYMRGGLNKTGPLASGSDPTRAQYYLHAAANQQHDAIDQLKAARLAIAERQAGLASAREQARRVLGDVNAKRKAAASAEDAQRALMAKVNGDLAKLVAAEQARRAAVVTRPTVAAAAAGPRASRGSTASIGTPPSGNNPAPNAGAQGAVDEAKKQIGKPYKWGASGPDSFDCSGFTSWVWRVGGGRSLPHSSRAQYSATSRVAMSDIRPGDLLFNGSSVSSIHHVGIYVGGGQMISAPQSGEVVKYQNAFRSDVVGIGRVN